MSNSQELHNACFTDWSKLTYVSDEMVIPTLSRVRIDSLFQVNNSWSVIQDLEPVDRFRFALWKNRGKEKCKGFWRKESCVFSLADLPTLVKAKTPIINKVISEHDPAIGECIRDSVRQRDSMELVDQKIEEWRGHYV